MDTFPGLKKIVSGGQTGVDRAALDAALDAGFACGGWCPKGRKAEDGRIPRRYPLQERSSQSYAARTRQNVLDSDGTLLIVWGPATGGSALTQDIADDLGSPLLVVDAMQEQQADALQRIAPWLQQCRISVLNIAGPRASTAPAAYAYTYQLVTTLLTQTHPAPGSGCS